MIRVFVILKYSIIFCSLFVNVSFSSIRSDSGKNSCDLQSIVTRTFSKDGFHRSLDYFIEVPYIDGYESCKLCVQEIVPDNFYVDPDEINRLVLSGELSVSINDSVDVELPRESAVSFALLLYSDLYEFNGVLVTKLSLPMHVRYHAARPGGGTVTATLNEPTVLLYCPKLACPDFSRVFPCSPGSDEKCLFKTLNITEEGDAKLEVPVGDLHHYFMVGLTTNLVVWLGLLYVLYILLFHFKE